jgi:hypothetical protein
LPCARHVAFWARNVRIGVSSGVQQHGHRETSLNRSSKPRAARRGLELFWAVCRSLGTRRHRCGPPGQRSMTCDGARSVHFRSDRFRHFAAFSSRAVRSAIPDSALSGERNCSNNSGRPADCRAIAPRVASIVPCLALRSCALYHTTLWPPRTCRRRGTVLRIHDLRYCGPSFPALLITLD